jgi:hypothetical protein
MEQSKLYIKVNDGKIVMSRHRHSVMMLTKILFRLEVIDEEQALKIATKFRILFV